MPGNTNASALSFVCCVLAETDSPPGGLRKKNRSWLAGRRVRSRLEPHAQAAHEPIDIPRLEHESCQLLSLLACMTSVTLPPLHSVPSDTGTSRVWEAHQQAPLTPAAACQRAGSYLLKSGAIGVGWAVIAATATAQRQGPTARGRDRGPC
jgi:hypothetical protein